jgi:hypothetical protein
MTNPRCSTSVTPLDQAPAEIAAYELARAELVVLIGQVLPADANTPHPAPWLLLQIERHLDHEATIVEQLPLLRSLRFEQTDATGRPHDQGGPVLVDGLVHQASQRLIDVIGGCHEHVQYRAIVVFVERGRLSHAAAEPRRVRRAATSTP